MAKKAETKVKKEKLNPFVGGVTYDDLLKDCGGVSKAREYLKDVISESGVDFIMNELEQYKSNKK